MRLYPLGLVLACLGFAMTAPANAVAQPSLPPDDPNAGAVDEETDPAAPAPSETPDPGAPPALGEDPSGAMDDPDAPVEDSESPVDVETEPDVLGPDAAVDVEGPEPDSSLSLDAEAEKNVAATPVLDDSPDMVRGRREPAVNSLRGGLGLYHTTLADVGGRHSVRFRLHTDFFTKSSFIYDSSEFGPDKNTRFRGAINLGYSPFKWGEVFFTVESSVNKNARAQPDRQDPVTNFALGDMTLGLKGAHRFYKGGAIGVGGQMALGLLAGADRLAASGVNFNIDALFTLDIRHLTASKFPFRFTTNIGWMLDNSTKLQDWAQQLEPTSREIMRFGLGVNHSRVRMRYAVDFPFRLGKERQFGLDPIVELAWDASTQEELEVFGQPGAQASPLPRSTLWTTIGLRANVIAGLHLDAAIDIGMVSPNFEFGPPVPPYQIILGLGWSIDPKPPVRRIEVPAPVENTEQVVLDGRLTGRVIDANGEPLVGAKISFPGLAANPILTDDSGYYTSFRFPEGEVSVRVETAAGQTAEQVATVRPGEDTPLDITVGEAAGETAAAAGTTGILTGAFVDEAGKPVKVTMMVVGQGVEEPFEASETGEIALELPTGTYAATLTAAGFEERKIEFTVAEGDAGANVRETLTKGTPAETPNVRGNKRRISLKKRIRYKGNALNDKSHAILDELAAFLAGHPEYAKVEIGVYTDDRGNSKKRTQERADAVRTYLVDKGVSSDRIEAKGYGDKNPVAINMTASGRAKNNRTVLKVRTFTGGDGK
ncbi:MAG: carboxypeptidase regulatory-like domain-containing protein [Nannocystaceae bacterium]